MDTYYLWNKNETPYYNKDFGQDEPTVTYFPIESKEPSPCVIVFPGGGYGTVAFDYEGEQACEALNEKGYAGFILRYRVAPHHHPCPLLDAKRAIRFVRANAEKFNIDPNRIGILGFSAGGHLADTAGLLFDYGDENGDEIDRVSSRPNSVCSCYAVASLDSEVTNPIVRVNLFGENDDDALAKTLSPESIIPDDAPPFFIWHTAEDTVVDVRCSLRLANALADKKMLFELHIFPYGRHGIALGKGVRLADQWFDLYINWLNAQE